MNGHKKKTYWLYREIEVINFTRNIFQNHENEKDVYEEIMKPQPKYFRKKKLCSELKKAGKIYNFYKQRNVHLIQVNVICYPVNFVMNIM